MKITLQNKEEIELTEREERIYEAGKNSDDYAGLLIQLIFIAVAFLLGMFFGPTCNAQSAKTVYRQTLIIKSGKPISISRQKVIVNYLDQIYEYNSKLNKRRKALIVFGKEGISPLSDWVKYDPKENDTIYNFKRSL